MTTGQAQTQALRESVAKLTSERDALKKDLQARTNDIQEKGRTITQVKKIGRRYKTQYDELKVLHDKVCVFGSDSRTCLLVCVFIEFVQRWKNRQMQTGRWTEKQVECFCFPEKQVECFCFPE